MAITIIKDKFLIEHIKEYSTVLVPMNANNSMNKGFAYEIGLNFPEIKEKIRSTPYGDRRKFGTVSVFKSSGITFCICFMHTGGQASQKQPVFVKYDSLADCLDLINKEFKGQTVASPILGSSKYDGRGDKETIIKIFEEHCPDVDLILYDYEERNFLDEIYYRTTTVTQSFRRKEITLEQMLPQLNKIMWEKYHGIFVPMPEDYKYIRPRLTRPNEYKVICNKNVFLRKEKNKNKNGNNKTKSNRRSS